MKRLISISFVAGVALLVGCASPVTPAERPWVEIRSRHLSVLTDLAADDAQRLTLDFERAHAAVRACVHPVGSEAPGLIQVVVPANWTDYRMLSAGTNG